jgi:hypothetical protein
MYPFALVLLVTSWCSASATFNTNNYIPDFNADAALMENAKSLVGIVPQGISTEGL